MDCEDVLEQLDALILSDVALPGRTYLLGHLERCPACHEDYQQRLALLAQVRLSLRHPLPVNRLADLRREIMLERTHRRTEMLVREGVRGMVRRAFAIAAVLSLMAWLGASLEERVRERAVSPLAIESTIESLVDNESVAPSNRSFLLTHRVSLERYLAAAAGQRSAEPEISSSRTEKAANVPADRVGSEDVIETRWTSHYSA